MLQHGAFAYIEQQDIKCPKISGVKQFKHENQRCYLYEKRETKTYEPLQQNTTTKQQVPGIVVCLTGISMN